jgi:hypothetical protein
MPDFRRLVIEPLRRQQNRLPHTEERRRPANRDRRAGRPGAPGGHFRAGSTWNRRLRPLLHDPRLAVDRLLIRSSRRRSRTPGRRPETQQQAWLTRRLRWRQRFGLRGGRRQLAEDQLRQGVAGARAIAPRRSSARMARSSSVSSLTPPRRRWAAAAGTASAVGTARDATTLGDGPTLVARRR